MSSSQPAASPLFPRSALHPAALARAEAHADGNAPWCVAFSGGADSLALLTVLREHFPAQKLVALHFNHHLRGAASDGDEQFCRETCAALGVDFRVGHWRHAPRADAAGTNVSEAEARENRHAFFDREMSELGASVLWLGHQRDDIAETQLMRLARGSSSAGLAAPRPVHGRSGGRVFLRPLLTLSKKEITGALLARGLVWREDATNAAAASDGSGDYFRNRIRRDVLPAWVAAAENDALAGAALTRELLEEDASALDVWLDELMPPNGDTGCQPMSNALDLRPLAGKPRALLRRALRRWPPAAHLARPGFEALLAICESPANGRTSIGQNVAIFENGILRIDSAASDSSSVANPAFSCSATFPFALDLPGGAKLTARQITLTDGLRAEILSGIHNPIHTIFIMLPPPRTEFVIRPWRPGDRYRPLGAPGSAKVSDLFINRKIPHDSRLSLPVVCIERDNLSEILWVPGLPPADAWKIDPQTKQALHLTYQGGTCTLNG